MQTCGHVPRYSIHKIPLLLVSLTLTLALSCETDDGTLGLIPSCSPVQDLFYANQWHLRNVAQTGGASGEDANVKDLWDDGVCGFGVQAAIVSDGLDVDHPDLIDNVILALNHNYVTGGTDPGTGGSGSGTALAGVFAAYANRIGIRGVAPFAKLRGYNLSENRTTANEVDAMTRELGIVDIYLNDWGPEDLSGKFNDSTSEWRTAIDTSLNSGRRGLGALFFFPAGDGAESGAFTGIDDSNLNGYANYQGVMAICGVGQTGVRTQLSEQGANLLICGHSRGTDGVGIATTDTVGTSGFNNGGSSSDFSDSNYTKTYSGTRAAMAQVAGVAALMIAVNPDLSWRDVRIILARSARKNDATDSDWTTNGAGLPINHKYGFGVVDGAAAVDMARTWRYVSSQIQVESSTSNVATTITDGSATGVTNSIVVSGTGINHLEFVEVRVTLNINYLRDLDITLTSPSGTQSRLLSRGSDGICVNVGTSSIEPNGNCLFNGTLRLGVLRTMGESADGTWTLNIRDQGARATANGTFTSWNMKFYGY